MVGNSDVKKAYVGNTVVWESLSPLRTLYYTSTSGQVIDMQQSGITSNTNVDGRGIITFSYDVTEIASYAFNSKYYLTSVIIPDGVTIIGNYSFSNCWGLSSITIPQNVITISQEAFAGSHLSSVTIPDNVININQQAFLSCHYLSSLIIGNGVTSISHGAFADCTLLSNIEYRGTKSQWAQIQLGETPFADCPATVIHCSDGDVPI